MNAIYFVDFTLNYMHPKKMHIMLHAHVTCPLIKFLITGRKPSCT